MTIQQTENEYSSEERSSTRIEPARESVVVHGLATEPVQAIVINEALSGLALAVPPQFKDPVVGQRLTVELDSVAPEAIIRHIAPLPTGVRLGVEWIASGLGRTLRILLKTSSWVDHPVSQLLPSGVSSLWKLCEAGAWNSLQNSIDRLRRECVNVEIPGLIAAIDQLASEVDEIGETNRTEPQIRAVVEESLLHFVRRCSRLLHTE